MEELKYNEKIAVIKVLTEILNADNIQQKRCEQFRQEKLKEGWPEKLIDNVLLSNEFMLSTDNILVFLSK